MAMKLCGAPALHAYEWRDNQSGRRRETENNIKKHIIEL